MLHASIVALCVLLGTSAAQARGRWDGDDGMGMPHGARWMEHLELTPEQRPKVEQARLQQQARLQSEQSES